MSQYSELFMQAVLMRWVLDEKRHNIAVPNSTMFYPWEADLASVTKSGYSHEFEIKISLADYRRDAKTKERKHYQLKCPTHRDWAMLPNYFWYAICEGFEVDPPEYAGLVVVQKNRSTYQVVIKRQAPKLHNEKVPEAKIMAVGRLLSFRVASAAWKTSIKP